MQIRKATAGDVPGVVKIYEELLDAQDAGRRTIGWVRGVYPTAETARAALARGDLFVLEDGEILAAAIINQRQVDAYYGAPWEYEAADEQVCVLHTLVVSPRASGRGYGPRFVAFYEDYARAMGCPELRMDTNAKTAAARALYAHLGYHEVAIIPTVFNGIRSVNLVLLEKHLEVKP